VQLPLWKNTATNRVLGNRGPREGALEEEDQGLSLSLKPLGEDLAAEPSTDLAAEASTPTPSIAITELRKSD
jgi:hypothetical protein